MSSEHVQFFLKGLVEAFNWPHVIHLITTSKSVQTTLLKSLALNGVAYLGILIILETFYNTPDHHLFGYSYTDLTGYPLYLICLVFNSKFYTQIAQGKRNIKENLDVISSIKTIILYGNFALFLAALRFIPYLGSAISFLIYSIIMSYYCFEYKWINQDWTVEQRMVYAEQHWAYYLGFGLPASIITFFLSTLRAGGVFALVYPSYIMMASVATPEPIHSTVHTFKLSVFIVIRYMNQCILSFIQFVTGSKNIMETEKDNLGKLV